MPETYACPDCGTNAGDECDPSCPSALAALLELDENWDVPCCSSLQAAARNLCYCWGGRGGQWIGSAA